MHLSGWCMGCLSEHFWPILNILSKSDDAIFSNFANRHTSDKQDTRKKTIKSTLLPGCQRKIHSLSVIISWCGLLNLRPCVSPYLMFIACPMENSKAPLNGQASKWPFDKTRELVYTALLHSVLVLLFGSTIHITVMILMISSSNPYENSGVMFWCLNPRKLICGSLY